MKRVIFVDDEQDVLDGLESLLRKHRKKWDMVFCLGGKTALEKLQAETFDVIISDMRMPDMDGVTLLTEVKAKYPSMARIILSGQADRDSLKRGLFLANRYLDKPCSAEVLQDAIERTSDLSRAIDSEPLRRMIGSLEDLPSPPKVYQAFMDVLMHPNSSVSDLAVVVERDPALTLKILQIANSGYFGAKKQISSIREALSFLGVDIVKDLSLGLEAFRQVGSKTLPPYIDALQQRAIVGARIAQRVLTGSAVADLAFTAVLLQDVGMLLMHAAMPQVHESLLLQAKHQAQPLMVVEKESLGFTYAEAGAHLLSTWGMPLEIVECVVFHPRPSAAHAQPSKLIAAVHALDSFLDDALRDLVAATPEAERPPLQVLIRTSTAVELDLPYIELSGCKGELSNWRATVREEIRKDRKLW